MRHNELWNELQEKLEKGKEELQEISCRQADIKEKNRIDGKTKGIELVIEWMNGFEGTEMQDDERWYKLQEKIEKSDEAIGEKQTQQKGDCYIKGKKEGLCLVNSWMLDLQTLLGID